MSKKKLIIFVLFLFIALGVALTVINIRPSKAIYYNGHRYTNQNVIVPSQYLEGKIGSKNGYAFWKILNANEEYHLAVKIDNNYYFYKTKDANGINFTE